MLNTFLTLISCAIVYYFQNRQTGKREHRERFSVECLQPNSIKNLNQVEFLSIKSENIINSAVIGDLGFFVQDFRLYLRPMHCPFYVRGIL